MRRKRQSPQGLKPDAKVNVGTKSSDRLKKGKPKKEQAKPPAPEGGRYKNCKSRATALAAKSRSLAPLGMTDYFVRLKSGVV
jgi:hypothetical protein